MMLDVKVQGLLFVLGSRNPSSAELRVGTVHANPEQRTNLGQTHQTQRTQRRRQAAIAVWMLQEI